MTRPSSTPTDAAAQPGGLNATQADAPAAPTRGAALEIEIARTGEQLLTELSAVLDALPDTPQGPQMLAKRLGVDKVLASRVLKAMRSPDPMSVIHRIPGPEPLRRLLKGIARQGVEPQLIDAAQHAVDHFEHLIRNEIGDRSALDTIISAWVPEARREFQLRRKQSAFKAMSQLKGAQAQVIQATVILHPSDDGAHLDIAWIQGLIGLHRSRPGAGVKLVTRRLAPAESDRQPVSLDGKPITSHKHVQIPEFCSSPLPELDVEKIGEVVHYTLADDGFGPRSAVDLAFGEVNYRELRRTVPVGSGRKAHMFAETSTPAKVMQFDVFVHEDVYPNSDPAVRVYDTSFEGIADVNNPARDIDQLEVVEQAEPLGTGLVRARSSDVPRYTKLLQYAFDSLGWNAGEFRGYRCRIDYPIYGSQVTLIFDPPEV